MASQQRRRRLPQPNSYANTYSYPNTDAYPNSNSNTYSYSDTHPNANANGNTYPDA